MTTIATFNKPEDAHLLRMRLEAGGIAAFLIDENVAQLGRSFMTDGVRVQVADEDVAATRELLVAQDAEGESDVE